jgi:hypothetical protein
MPRVPKAKIQRAHKLADELLAIWQEDIRDWAVATHGRHNAGIADNSIHATLDFFRRYRSDVERTEKP